MFFLPFWDTKANFKTIIIKKNMQHKNKWYFYYTNQQEDGGNILIFTSHLNFTSAQLEGGHVKMTMVKLPEDAPTMYLSNSLGAEVPVKAGESEVQSLPVDFYKTMVYNTKYGRAYMYGSH